MEKEDKILLKVKHVDVKFHVRGRVLNAIRDANLEIKDGETLAIVGESGSGKSVLTKTFAGMLDSNGFISHGNVYFYDDELSYTETKLTPRNLRARNYFYKKLCEDTYSAAAGDIFLQIEKLQAEMKAASTLSKEKEEEYEKRLKDLSDDRNDLRNERAVHNPLVKADKEIIRSLNQKIIQNKKDVKALEKERKEAYKQAKSNFKTHPDLKARYEKELAELNAKRNEIIAKAKEKPLTEEQKRIAMEVANEIVLSTGRYPLRLFFSYAWKILKGFELAYNRNRDLSTEKQRRRVFEPIVFRVEYREETEKETNSMKILLDEDFIPLLKNEKIDAEILHNETLIDQARALHPFLRKHYVKVLSKVSKENGYTNKVDEENVEALADLILLRIGRFDSTLFAMNEGGKILKWLKGVFASKKTKIDSSAYPSKMAKTLIGYAYIDCAKVRYLKDWEKIRGCKIATVFQDPMTSLNPILTIGKQIMMVIQKHQKVSKFEAKRQAIEMMGKVGIPDPEKRFDDYPFQYSGGMRQRIVIAIALSCQPKILICDEPTTALDVTIQAQIIRLIKKLSKDLGFTTIYITHDLGVVANVADRVAVLYGGQIVELGTVEDIFYEPAHPYTWALLSSLPQLGQRGEELFSIAGTPPSLYNKIVGDAFAPRNQYAMAIDFVKEPPMFEINDHHWAKTWLLDPRSPKVEKPEVIKDLHEKMVKIYKDF